MTDGGTMVEAVTTVLERPWFGGMVETFLKRAGMSRRVLGASEDRIPAGLHRVLWEQPELSVETLLAGERPERGFGLVGGAGLGKTFALAVIFRRMVIARVTPHVAERGIHAFDGKWFVWCSWPEVVNRLRVMSTTDGGLEEAQSVIDGMAAAQVLVIDDLGAERLRGPYAEDWSASLLDQLIDERYNEIRPTWWTSNLKIPLLQERYGERMFSRLHGENPGVAAPAGPDMRLMPRTILTVKP
jgi:DNA replication protein DnaC